MEGEGLFKHANGREYEGTFRRNYFLKEKCFVNPLDDDKKTRKIIKLFEDNVLANKEKIQYEQRLRLFKIRNGTDLKQAFEQS